MLQKDEKYNHVVLKNSSLISCVLKSKKVTSVSLQQHQGFALIS